MALFRRPTQKDGRNPFIETLQRIGQAAPVREQESDRLRKRLRLAGHHVPSAALIFSGIRMACAALMGLVVLIAVEYWVESLDKALLAALCAALFGFKIPNLILNRWIRRRAQRLRAGLPMVLDLLVLSLEAGQSLDAALIDTGRQLRDAFPDLSAELSLVQLEIFANKSRAEAFQNWRSATRRSKCAGWRRCSSIAIDLEPA